MNSIVQYLIKVSVVTRIQLYGNRSFKDEVILLILNATIDFVLSTNRFDESLYLL